jgi:hypothetical protein
MRDRQSGMYRITSILATIQSAQELKYLLDHRLNNNIPIETEGLKFTLSNRVIGSLCCE